ncbi:MAG: hypothetical protein ATN36_06940 [Epulopiscium sp. Nele67-Bin005]|nr:MAG: hypothetical protein ATN36_06940 [Epulopiscium sp. Nele67-Bin005]
MKKLTFRSGIHIPNNKVRTYSKKIEVFNSDKDFVFPMKSTVPCVEIGERVLVGQRIAEPIDNKGVPAHSSISGIVKAIERKDVFFGELIENIVIKNDNKFETVNYNSSGNYKSLLAQEIIGDIKNAGIVGLGGAAFPTFLKLSPPNINAIDAIIINGAECEPYLTCDYRLMVENTHEIIEGARILLHLFPYAKVYIGVEDDKMEAITQLEKMISPSDGGKIIIKKLITKYPQGYEKNLIYSILEREVPVGKLPLDVGCIVQNVGTIVAICRAITTGEALIRRVVTVSGAGVRAPKNLEVRLGTSFREVLKYCDWNEDDTIKIIAGGPMMGSAIIDIDAPITKGVSGVLCFTKDAVSFSLQSNCIRCSKCVNACPMYLLPNMLNQLSIRNKYADFKNYNGMSCMECGSCTYICPSKRHLVQTIRKAKFVIGQTRV